MARIGGRTSGGPGPAAAVVLLWTLLGAASLPASAGGSTQAWGNVAIGWTPGEKVYTELDIEPKVLISGEPKWWNVDLTPLVEYYPNGWIDLSGEMVAGRTLQTDDLRTTELTFRAGVRLHFLRNVQDLVHQERRPLGRVGVSTLIRLEERNFWYSDDTPSQHEMRLRARLEFKAPLNHADLAADGTIYLLADAEGYVPLGEEVDERFANKFRTRVGLGYRVSARHRVDLLYIRDWTRNSIEDDPSESSQAFDVRYRVLF